MKKTKKVFGDVVDPTSFCNMTIRVTCGKNKVAFKLKSI